MKKGMYVKPSVSVYEMEIETILAGSSTESPVNGMKADVEFGTAKGAGLYWGGDTKDGETYDPD